MEGKTYSQEEIKSKFRNDKCLECPDGNIYREAGGGWVSRYSCDSCNTRYEFQESDMGQTLPRLESNA